MDYRQTLDFLFSQLPMYQRQGAAAYKSNLDNTLSICKLLGNPEKRFPSIHIAGTNGKGSVAHMLASILQEAGYKTGLYTSPHLKDFRERIRVNGEMVPELEVIEYVEKGRDLFAGVNPSFFEYTFGMAMDYFANQEVDVAVVETGMGGRLDSTNVIRSIVSVITNIGMDHTQFLGDTLEKIAIEKAGIIKQGVPVVVGRTQEETTRVFRKLADNLNAEIHFADQEYEFQKEGDSPVSSRRSLLLVNKLTGQSRTFDLPFTTAYQFVNARTTITTLDTLVPLGFEIENQTIQAGFNNVIKNTGLSGRWQELGRNPLVICDTGHNEDGISEVVSQINTLQYDTLHMVFGTVEDKKLDRILDLLPRDAVYYFCKANIPRGLDQERLRILAIAKGLVGKGYNSVREAFDQANKNAESNDMVFVGGSTFVVAEVL